MEDVDAMSKEGVKNTEVYTVELLKKLESENVK
jgi:hypothetical protein